MKTLKMNIAEEKSSKTVTNCHTDIQKMSPKPIEHSLLTATCGNQSKKICLNMKLEIDEDCSKIRSERRGVKRKLNELKESDSGEILHVNTDLNCNITSVSPSNVIKSESDSKVKVDSITNNLSDASKIVVDPKSNIQKVACRLKTEDNCDSKPSDITSSYVLTKSHIIKGSQSPIASEKKLLVESSKQCQSSSDSQENNSENGSDKFPANKNESSVKNNLLKETTNVNVITGDEDHKDKNVISNTDDAKGTNDHLNFTKTFTNKLNEKINSNDCNEKKHIVNESLKSIGSKLNNDNRGVLSDSNSSSLHQSSTGSSLHSKSSNRKVYGLRPRSSIRRLWSGSKKERKPSSSSEDLPDVDAETEEIIQSSPTKVKPSNNGTTGNNSSNNVGGKSRSPRSKPLSKYRRITANARERDRMKEINTAFATLRAALPAFTNCRISSMTKYTTLQLAASYIRGLSDLLEETPPNSNSNKKENRPSLCNAAIGPNSGRDINLSVGISEIPYDRSQQSGNGDKQSDFNMYSNAMNGGNTFGALNDNHLDTLSDIDNLNDMCWTLDFMLE